MQCSVRSKLPSGEYVNCEATATHNWSKGISVCDTHHLAMVEQPKVNIEERREEYKKLQANFQGKKGLPAGHQKAF